MNYNSVTLAGRLAADPEYTKGTKPDGTDDRCWARLAVNRPTNDGKADFVPVCAWGPRARVLAQYGRKGKVVLIRGSLRTNNKQRPDGTYDNYTEVSVAEIILGPDAKGKNPTTPTPATNANPLPAQSAVPALTPEMVSFFQNVLTQQPEKKAAMENADNPFPAVG